MGIQSPSAAVSPTSLLDKYIPVVDQKRSFERVPGRPWTCHDVFGDRRGGFIPKESTKKSQDQLNYNHGQMKTHKNPNQLFAYIRYIPLETNMVLSQNPSSWCMDVYFLQKSTRF